MPTNDTLKIRTKQKNLFLRVARGHFATSHSHTNYYIDVSVQKSRLTEASAVAKALVSYYKTNTIVDTILCLDGMEVIGTCLAQELTKEDFVNMNAHQTIYVLTPEHTASSQLIFRDNMTSMINGKNVLILASSVVTGYTARSAMEAIRYYGGQVAGIASIFATVEECMGTKVRSIFDPNDLDGYASYQSHDCPLCKEGEKINALINTFGYSKL